MSIPHMISIATYFSDIRNLSSKHTKIIIRRSGRREQMGGNPLYSKWIAFESELICVLSLVDVTFIVHVFATAAALSNISDINWFYSIQIHDIFDVSEENKSSEVFEAENGLCVG